MDLPTGTVTFLFTDVEGSTALWEHQPQVTRAALVRHDAVIEAAVAAHGGAVVRPRGEGDSRFAVFARASDAVAAALAMQRALVAEAWPTPAPLRVRVALHSGEADLREGDYYGAAVNRCARLRAIAHGGQVLVSQATAHLVREALPPGASLRDLGEHRLRDLVQPEQVYQVLHPDLPADFPSLRSLDTFPHNLPLQLTSFVGREREMAEIRRLLATTRLLTLTGTGGCGKTRLALQVAADLVDAYANGVWLVELAPLADPALLLQTVAGVLGVSEQPGQPILSTLLAALKARRLLLVLDNCEHLLDACARFADTLLRACEGVRMLATSREALGIDGELAWRVPSLALPDLQRLPPLEELRQVEAVRLFVERAAFVQPSFTVTAQNALVVSQICARLDGIPLAIELAVARIRALPVDQLAKRLDDRFRLLTGGSRAALPRQQTLQALIDWSFALLSEAEQTLLRRLAVFAGGWTLEAAEAVGTGEGIELWEVLDLLTRLVDKSLVVLDSQEEGARYRLLETVRQYALERLLEAGEGLALRDRHRDWYLALAEQAELALVAADQLAWLARLEAEHDNLRAALAWCLEHDAEAALRLVGSLATFWRMRGRATEGRGWLERALRLPPTPTAGRVKALLAAGTLFSHVTDLVVLRAWHEECLRLGRELAEPRWVAQALRDFGHRLNFRGRREQARAPLEEGLALVRTLDDPHGLGINVMYLSRLAWAEGDYERARRLGEEALAVIRATGDRFETSRALWVLSNVALEQGDAAATRALVEDGLAAAEAVGAPDVAALLRCNLGHAALQQGDVAAAAAQYEAGLATARQLADTLGIARNLAGLGRVAWRRGDPAGAQARLREALPLYSQMEEQRGVVDCLERLAWAAAPEQPERVARLLGAAEALRQAIGAPLPPVDRPGYEATLQAIQVALGEAAFADAWAAGQALTLDEAIAEALAYAEAAMTPSPATS